MRVRGRQQVMLGCGEGRKGVPAGDNGEGSNGMPAKGAVCECVDRAAGGGGEKVCW